MTAVKKRCERLREDINIANNPELAKKLLKDLENCTVKRIIDGDVAYLESQVQINRLKLAIQATANQIESYRLERDGDNINHIISMDHTIREWVLIEEAKGNLADMLAGGTE